MPLSIELLKQMDRSHCINALRADFDPLTGTPLEQFLIDMLEQEGDANREVEPARQAMDDYDLTPADIRNLGDALIDNADHTVALLKAVADAPSDYSATGGVEKLAADLALATTAHENADALRVLAKAL